LGGEHVKNACSASIQEGSWRCKRIRFSHLLEARGLQVDVVQSGPNERHHIHVLKQPVQKAYHSAPANVQIPADAAPHESDTSPL